VSVRRNVVANHAGQAWAALVALICLPLYVEHLGIEAFGLIGAFAVLQAALSLFDVPIAASVNREMARFTAGAHTAAGVRSVLRTLEILCLAVAGLVISAVVVTRGYLAESWFQTGTVAPSTVREALLAMGIVAAVRLVEGLYRGALYGLQRQVFYSVANAVLSTLRFGGALIVVAAVSPTIEAFFLWQALTSFVAVIVLGLGVYRALPPADGTARWSSDAFHHLRDFTGGVMGITLVSLGLTQADKIVLSRLLPLETFGYYTLAVTVSNALYRLSEPIMDAVYPRLTELVAAGQRAGLAALYHDAAQLVSSCVVPAALVLSVFADGVLFAWTGDPVVAARTAPVLTIFAAGICLNCLMTVPYRLQLAHGWTSLALVGNTIYLVLALPALIWVAPRYGAIGGAAIWTLLNVAYLAINVPLMHRRVLPGELARYYLQDVLAPSAAAAAGVAVATFARPAPAGSRITWLVFLMAASAVAFALATAAAPALRRRIGTALGGAA
jgi:O-antigen/teichoic acid export membrane protein